MVFGGGEGLRGVPGDDRDGDVARSDRLAEQGFVQVGFGEVLAGDEGDGHAVVFS